MVASAASIAGPRVAFRSAAAARSCRRSVRVQAAALVLPDNVTKVREAPPPLHLQLHGRRSACGGSGSEAGGGGFRILSLPAQGIRASSPSMHVTTPALPITETQPPHFPQPSALDIYTAIAPPAPCHCCCRLPLPLLPQVMPKGDLVLAKVAEAEEKTTGGILLPGSAQTRPTSGEVVALGDGQVGTKQHAFTLKGGETVLYSRFGIGATELEVQGEQHLLIREDDLIGIMPRPNATAEGAGAVLRRGNLAGWAVWHC
jgi:co-chaperonin GroES (HSP10)